MSNRLAGRVCIITGTGGSMGRAAALLFAREGGLIVGCDINEPGALQTLDIVKSAGGRMVSLHPCNLTDPDDCQKLVDLAIHEYGRIDVLFNNAAMARFGAIDEMTIADWHGNINEELHLVFLLTRVAWPHLKANGGAIVNTASTSAHLGYQVLPGLAHSAAKGAVLAMTRHLAMEGRTHGIRANSVSPGLVETNQTRPFLSDPAWAGPMLNKIMLNRPGQPEEIAAAALFLASDEASFITGADLLVDGGTTAW